MSEQPHILVIEDHQPNAMLVCDLLSFHGFRVSWAPDGVTGLDMVTKDPPDLILMDLQLPRLDGFELTRRLKSDPQTSHIPIVALTACAMISDAERAMSAGCDGYLTKPINTRELPQTIRKFLKVSTANNP
ncbi:MAG: response regulator [Ardenticatenia bacterium]|nr:response regulator [Ardenticatenia bacterium]